MARAAMILLLSLLCTRAQAADLAGAPLPRRAKAMQDGRYASPMGFRDTVDWYAKELRRRGVNVQADGPVRFRDVTFVRFLPTAPGAPWSAIHIVLADGRTTIYILAASSAEPSGSKVEN